VNIIPTFCIENRIELRITFQNIKITPKNLSERLEYPDINVIFGGGGFGGGDSPHHKFKDNQPSASLSRGDL